MGRRNKHATESSRPGKDHPALSSVVAFNRILNAETDQAVEYTVVLGEVGAVVQEMKCTFETNRREPLKHMSVFVRTPTGKCTRCTNDPDKLSRDFRGQRVNGIWTVRLQWNRGRKRVSNGEILVRKIRLDFLQLNRVTLLADMGLVNTVLGDGSFQDECTNRLQAGQSPRASLGGRPWGVRYDAHGDVLFSGLDQGYLAKWTRESGHVSTLHSFDTPWRTLQPMVFDIDPRRASVQWIAVYSRNAIAEVDTQNGTVEWHMRGVLKHPMSCRFAIHAQGDAKDLLYVCDTGHHVVLQYHVRTRVVTPVLGVPGKYGITDATQSRARTLLDFPVDLSVYGTYLIVASGVGNRIVGANLDPLKVGFIGGRAVGPGCARSIVGSGPPMNPRPKDVFDVSLQRPRHPPRLYARSATEVEIRWPYCPRFLVAEQGGFSGDFVFISADSHTVELVTNGGIIMTVCGTGQDHGVRGTGAARESLLATAAARVRLNRPMSLDVRMPTRDQVSVVVADTDACCVREFSFRLRLEKPSASRFGAPDIRDLLNLKVSDQKMGMDSRYTNYGNLSLSGSLYGSFGFMYALYFVASSQVRPQFVTTGSNAPVLTASDPWACKQPSGRDVYALPPTAKLPVKEAKRAGLYLLRYVLDPNRVALLGCGRRGMYSEFWLLLQASRRKRASRLVWEIVWKIGTPSTSRARQLDGVAAWSDWDSFARIQYAVGTSGRRQKKAPVRPHKGSGRKPRHIR